MGSRTGTRTTGRTREPVSILSSFNDLNCFISIFLMWKFVYKIFFFIIRCPPPFLEPEPAKAGLLRDTGFDENFVPHNYTSL